MESDLDKQRAAYHEIEEENQSLRDDNRHLREKVEELRDDIEGISELRIFLSF
jgi:predicted nuclease with TOPRIM domain